MFEINITLDTSAFDEDVDSFMRRELMPALVDAVNVAAEAVRLRVVEAMSDNLDRPTPFTLQSVRVLPATKGGGRDPAALITFSPTASQYMQYVVYGGTHWSAS